MANRFDEMEALVGRLQDELREMTNTKSLIKRDTLATMPDAMESGSIVLMDDGAGDMRMVVQFGDTRGYVSFTEA